MARCYSRSIVRINDARTTPWWRPAIALAAVVWALVVAAEIAAPSVGASSPHLPHTLATSSGAEFAVVNDHLHFEDGSSPLAPPAFSTAIVPRGAAAALVALGVCAAAAVLSSFLTRPTVVPVRGPPRRSVLGLTGRDLATRLCVDRR